MGEMNAWQTNPKGRLRRLHLYMLSHIGADQRNEGSSEKVSSARLIVYTAPFIRAGLDFQDRVPVLSVLGLPLDMVRARVKFWSGTDGPKSFTRPNLSVPNQFFWYAYFFHPCRAKNFRPCKWGLNVVVPHKEWTSPLSSFYEVIVSLTTLSILI